MTVGGANSSLPELWLGIERSFNDVSALLKLVERLEGGTVVPFIEAQSRAALLFSEVQGVCCETEENRLLLRKSQAALDDACYRIGCYILNRLRNKWAAPLGKYLLKHKAVLSESSPKYKAFSESLSAAGTAIDAFLSDTSEVANDIPCMMTRIEKMLEVLLLYLSIDAEIDDFCSMGDVTVGN